MSQDDGFEVSVSVEPGGLTVAVAGDIDMATAPDMRRAVVSACESDTRVQVDLSRVTFMDAAGVSALEEAIALAAMDGRRLHLARPSRPVRRVFEVLGLSAALPAAD